MATIQKGLEQPGKPRISFQNAVVKEDGPILTARLGLERGRPSVFNYSSDRLSLSATVRKNPEKATCQDAIIIFISQEHVALGVFDGFQTVGTTLSERMADMVLSVLAKERSGRIIPTAFENLKLTKDLSDGGTTATVAFIYPDGGLYVSAAGDSPAFRLRRKAMERLLDYDQAPKGRTVTGMKPEEYFLLRSTVRNPISVYFKPSNIIEYGGIMDPGESLILSSDGLSKNLRMLFDPETGLISDSSCCQDLYGIIKGKTSPSSMVRAMNNAVRERTTDFVDDIPGTVIRPAMDDLAIIALMMHRLSRTF